MRRKKEGEGGSATPTEKVCALNFREEKLPTKQKLMDNQLDSFQISIKRRAKLIEERMEKVDLKKNQLDSVKNLSEERCNEPEYAQKGFKSKKKQRIWELELKEKQFANLIKFRLVAEQSGGISPTVNLGFMVTMDGKSLQLFLNDHIKNHDSIAGKVLEALKLSKDPAKLVLDAMEGFYPPHLKKGNLEFEGSVVKRSCILLLQLIMSISLEIRADVKDAALRLAAEWKRKMEPRVEDSLEMLGFLSLLAAYELDGDFDADKVLSHNEIVPQHRQTLESYPLLGYTDEIREGVNKEVGIPKVRAKGKEPGTSRKTNWKRGREFYYCLDPEFSDFDKDKDEKCFSVDQIWACYDTTDCLPRFYAEIKKVFSSGFKLRFTWLEPDPEEQGEIDWVNQELPVGCGKFVRGDTEVTSNWLTFSHQMYFEKGAGKGYYLIYPRKGETWALFKDWEIGWSSDLENHKKYIFEIVEILSDFRPDTGIEVGYLEKMKGFVSLFQRMTPGGDVIFVIPSSELLRFSHRVPSFKMTGTEREGVPEGSFELDPASLPSNPDELWQPEKVNVEAQSMNAKVNGSSSKSTFGSETTSTSKKGAASKLIDNSNMVVSYPGKKSMHISKGSFSGNATVIKRPHHVNQNQAIRNSFGAQNKTSEYLNPQFSGSNHHHLQLIQPDQSNGQKSFWTCCPFCKTKYQYRRYIVNRIVCCQKCLWTFMACDSGAQGELLQPNCSKTGNQDVTCNSSLGQPGNCQQKQATKQEAIKLCAKVTGGFQFSLLGSKVNSSTKVMPEPVIRPAVASVVGGSLKTKGKNNWRTTTDSATDEGAQEKQQRSNQDKTGGQDVGSSSISQWKVGAQSNEMVPCSLSRSSRTGGSDLVTRTGGANEIGGCLKTKGDDDRLVDIPVVYAPAMTNTNKKRGRKSIIESRACYVSYNESLRDDFMSPSKWIEAEPELSDFDKDREESYFSVDQVWACYDSIDGMPRLYAQVRKILSYGFMLEISWLNANPEEQYEIDWVKEGLPVACGKFINGKTAISCDHSEFSHQIFCEKATKGSYEIYPRKGETWALFKNWDISWKSEPENHKDYIYEIVEILSDYSHHTGIHVTFLEKVEGFVSLFQRSTRLGVPSFLIPSSELLRFSHQIPAFKMTGAKREGVPVGSFELDPASLPANVNELCHARKEMIETESTSAKEKQIARTSDSLTNNASPNSSAPNKRSWENDIKVYHRKVKVKGVL